MPVHSSIATAVAAATDNSGTTKLSSFLFSILANPTARSEDQLSAPFYVVEP